MNGRIILLKDRKPNKFGEYPISLCYSTQGVGVRKSTGIFVAPEHFIYDTGRNTKFIKTGRGGHPKGDFLNKRLLNIKQEFDKTIASYMTEPNVKMTVPMLRSILNGNEKERREQQNGKVPFIQYVLDVNQDLYKKGKIGISVWQNIQCNMNVFDNYLKEVLRINTNPNNTLYCKDIKADIINGYIIWRLDVRKNSNNTINKSLTPIFKTIKRLINVGWLKKEVGTEILELYLPTKSKSLADPNDGDVDYLTTEQVKQLISIVEKSKYPRTKDNFDLFLFSLNCGGLRFSDCCTLRWIEVNMEECMIKHLMVKNHTKRPVILNLPITSEAMKILKRWIGRFDNFVFGQLDDEFDLDDYKKLKLTLNSRNRTVNQTLQGIGEKIEPSLPFRLHHHIARHTFASWAINRGIDVKTISDLMAHSTSAVTEKIYAKLFPTTIKDTVIKKLDFELD